MNHWLILLMINLLTNIIKNNVTFLSESSFEKLRNIRKFENSLSVTYNNSLERIFRIIIGLTNDIYSRNFLDLDYNDIPKDTIAIRDGKFENLVPKSRFLDKSGGESRIDDLIQSYLGNDLSIYPILKGIYRLLYSTHNINTIQSKRKNKKF